MMEPLIITRAGWRSMSGYSGSSPRFSELNLRDRHTFTQGRNHNMNILITNDDGLGSPGLERLVEEYRDKHEIWVVAPDGERSGSSHAITLKGAVRFQQFEERIFSCSGTPVDCVLMSVLGAIPEKPDLVLSGINLGPNIGTDILYSGT